MDSQLDTAKPLNLDTIPTDIAENIAFYVATLDPFRPPSDLVSLLQTSPTLHSSLSPSSHPHLYARVFRAQFDTSALKRRFPASSLAARFLGEELRKRWECLGRIRGEVMRLKREEQEEEGEAVVEAAGLGVTGKGKARAGEKGSGVVEVTEEDLWRIYMMCLEDDGKNYPLLSTYALLPAFISLYRQQHLVPHLPYPPPSFSTTDLPPGTPSLATNRNNPLLPGDLDRTPFDLPALVNATRVLPKEGASTALALWIFWFVGGEREREREEEERRKEGKNARRGRAGGRMGGSGVGRSESVGSIVAGRAARREARRAAMELRADEVYMLRLYVFAAQKFDAFFTPWTQFSIPIPPIHPSLLPTPTPTSTGHPASSMSTSPSSTSNSSSTPNTAQHAPPAPPAASPFAADLTPRSRAVMLNYPGSRPLEISPPISVHAALLSFMERVRAEDEEDDINGASDGEDEDATAVEEDDPFASGATTPMDVDDGHHRRGILTTAAALGGGADTPTRIRQNPMDDDAVLELPFIQSATADLSLNATAGPSSSSSSSNLNPNAARSRPPTRPSTRPPTRASSPSALPPREGIRGPSPQFDFDHLRLTSCLNPIASSPPPSLPSAGESEELTRGRGSNGGGLGIWACRGTVEGVWGGLFSFLDFDSYRDMLSGRTRAIYEGPYGIQPQIIRLTETLLLRPPTAPNPSSSNPPLNAFFPASWTHPSHTSASTSSSSSSYHYPSGDPLADGEALSGVSGYRVVSEEEEERMRSGEGREQGGESVEERLEIVLSGTGHSAWGRFHVSGRLRVWDGAVYLVKEYFPDSRGKWLYRGYVTAGGSMVGRWRDTFTPENFNGYEGCFHMTKRA